MEYLCICRFYAFIGRIIALFGNHKERIIALFGNYKTLINAVVLTATLESVKAEVDPCLIVVVNVIAVASHCKTLLDKIFREYDLIIVRSKLLYGILRIPRKTYL